MIYAEWRSEINEIATFIFTSRKKMDERFQSLADGIGKPVKVTYKEYNTRVDQINKTYTPQAKKGK